VLEFLPSEKRRGTEVVATGPPRKRDDPERPKAVPVNNSRAING